MTILILLVLVVLLWVAVLAPSAWRRFVERQGVGSIDHFHHQLQLLEHAGPKTVAPAYRLHTACPAWRRRGDIRRLPRLVPPQARAAPADRRRGSGRRRRQRGMSLRAGRRARPPRPRRACPRPARICRPSAGEQARRRCTSCCAACAGVAISTGADRLVPGPAPGLGVHRLCGRRRARAGRPHGVRQGARAERQRRTARRARSARRPRLGRRRPAAAGYPGAWDDEDDGRGPPPLSGAPGRAQGRARGAGSARTILESSRGCSSAGRALRSQCRGRGFESLHLHQRVQVRGQKWEPPEPPSAVERYMALCRGREIGVHPCSWVDDRMFLTVRQRHQPAFASHGDDDLASGIALLEVPDGCRGSRSAGRSGRWPA